MQPKNILIIGAGKAGKLLANNIKETTKNTNVIGFIDDHKSKVSDLSHLGTIEDIPKIIIVYKVDEIIIAIPSADGILIRKILLLSIDNRIPIKIVPRDLRVISKSDVKYSEVRNLDAEDFLGRPFVRRNIEKLKSFYTGKTVLITGGAGSIGSEIVRQLIALETKKVIVYDNSEYLIFLLEQQLKEQGIRDRCELVIGSILNSDKLNSVFLRTKPEIVFHAAAYKHVHLMQENIDEAITNNAIGTKRVIQSALACGIKIFTFISTDKVVNPTSIMGATKKLCEFYIQSQKTKNTKFNIVRFGNVINSNGSALPLFERQMELYKYITVTDKKMRRFFMSIREAASLVIESTAKNQSNRIHILNMGELINIYDISLCLIRAKNLIPGKDVEIKLTGLRKGEKLTEELYTRNELSKMKYYKTKNLFFLGNLDKCPTDIGIILEDLESILKNNAKHDELRNRLINIFPSLENQ